LIQISLSWKTDYSKDLELLHYYYRDIVKIMAVMEDGLSLRFEKDTITIEDSL